MILSKTIKTKWNSKTKKYYEELGYTYTKMGDEFEVKVEHLKSCSAERVLFRCDYCGKEFTKKWGVYVRDSANDIVKKDCCSDCKEKKALEAVNEKYGVDNVFKLDEVKEKIKKTNLEKYGTEYATQSDVIKEKTKQTCIDKYGVSTYLYLTHKKGEEHMRWKGGVKYHRQERSTSEYIDWRKSVYERDRYTCQCCGDKSAKGNPVKLNAHHIQNRKDNPENRYDIDNGITLCESCHTQFHSEYGKSNNTKSQLKNYILNHGKKIC